MPKGGLYVASAWTRRSDDAQGLAVTTPVGARFILRPVATLGYHLGNRKNSAVNCAPNDGGVEFAAKRPFYTVGFN